MTRNRHVGSYFIGFLLIWDGMNRKTTYSSWEISPGFIYMCEVLFPGVVSEKASLTIKDKMDFLSSPPPYPSQPSAAAKLCSECRPASPEGRRGSSPAGNQPSFFHEAVSVQERLWISPAASASNTSCYTLGNMTSALPPSSLHLNTLLYLMTWWVKSDLLPLRPEPSFKEGWGRCIDLGSNYNP